MYKWLIFLSLFLSSVLVLLIQPVVIKTLLPFFGSTIGVWLVSFLFFQFFLLLGYLYSCVIVKNIDKKIFKFVHILIGLIGFWQIYRTATTMEWINSDFQNIEFSVLKTLTNSISIPFLYLSSNTTFSHYLYENTNYNENSYRVYSISNLGSCIGFLLYPFVIEPFLNLKTQYMIFLFLYTIFFFFVCFFTLKTNLKKSFEEENNENFEKKSLSITALFLSFIINFSLFVVLDQFNKNFPPLPFVVVIPMAGFFISFFLAFANRTIYTRKNILVIVTLLINVFIIALFGYKDIYDISYFIIFVFLNGSVFLNSLLLAMYIYKQRENTKYPLLYLSIAIGGFLGSVVYLFLVPKVFTSFLEFYIIYITIFLSIALYEREIKFKLICIFLIFITCIFAFTYHKNFNSGIIFSRRDFYNINRVVSERLGDGEIRSFFNGKTLHGEQLFSHNEPLMIPTAYYSYISGFGIVLNQLKYEKNSMNIGVVGLGVGTMFAYSRPYDTYTFFEINPNVAEIASNFFYFLKNGEGKFKIELGDGRIKIQEYPDKFFDVLVLDAFSGGQIPYHLLTRESFDIHFRKLKDDGYLLVHITNKYLKLKGLMKSIAKEFGKEFMLLYSDKNINYFESFNACVTLKHNDFTKEFELEIFKPSIWVVLSNNDINLKIIENLPMKSIPYEDLPKLWQDDYSSILPFLKF